MGTVACVLCFHGRVETDGSAAMRGDVELSVVDAVADERSRFVATLTPHRARELAALLLELAANAEAHSVRARGKVRT